MVSWALGPERAGNLPSCGAVVAHLWRLNRRVYESLGRFYGACMGML